MANCLKHSIAEKVTILYIIVFLKKGAAKPKKAKEVEKAKAEEKAPEAPAENGETKAEEDVRVVDFYANIESKCCQLC